MCRYGSWIKFWILTGLLATLVFLCGCRNGRGRTAVVADNRVAEYYKVPVAPSMLSGQERIDDFYARNWWRDFDFSDSLQAALTDSVYFMGLFSDWTRVLERVPDVGPGCVEDVMSRASATKKCFDMFVMAAREVLADPNSPLRDDELYMPVLRVRIASPFTDEATRERLRYRLDILSQNRLGHKANNIRYTLFDGFEGTLYGIRAEYTLVFINNPGCELCRTVREEICASALLTNYISSAVLRCWPFILIRTWMSGCVTAVRYRQIGLTATTRSALCAPAALITLPPSLRSTCWTPAKPSSSRTQSQFPSSSPRYPAQMLTTKSLG